MKTETKEKQNDSFKTRVPKVTINPEMEKDKDKIYFPEKLAKANEMLKTPSFRRVFIGKANR